MERKRKIVRRRSLNDDFLYYSSRLTVAEALNKIKLIFVSEGYRDRTINDYEMYWKEFFKIIEAEYIDTVSTDDFRAYVHHLLKERGLSPVTVNIRLTSMRSMFNRLFKEGILGRTNPVENIRKLRTDEPKVKGLKDEHILRLFSVIDKDTYPGYRDYCAMLLMLKCGLRLNEINALEVADIDFDDSVIHLTGSKNKNRKRRIIPVPKKVLQELKHLASENRKYFGNSVRMVFLNHDGTPLLDDHLRKRMHLYAEKCGLKGSVAISPHKLRHTFAINFLKNGGDIRALQLIMGHADLSTTQVYLTYSNEDIKYGFNKVDKNDNLDV
ncbi:tyrosine-type recombinase/integrase [Bacillus tianshenii]|uniref:tyrosine-type recombinase/integrase n=1 Tax=Sutcliffiella tianshenii TaxID=1463404 RepID=UPI001CD72F35|nr:tyrosine-type recombinase/integrase [Bacillus tianshenii]MCA1319767.1 tyrosine-type recombinase/integrase [Bacillus tianshenii]